MRIGIIAALPGELKPLVRGWRSVTLKDGTRRWTQDRDGDTWIAACSGMGADAALRAVAAAEADGKLDKLLSVGWAGAVAPDVQVGQAYMIAKIVDAQTGERFRTAGGEQTLVTTARVADAAEKIRLRAAYGAALVDMEGAVVARLAQIRGIPAACIKGVSDDVEAELPDINPFIGLSGQLRLWPFLTYVALRPRFWRPVAELGRNSAKAATAISGMVLEFMQEKNIGRLGRTGNP